MEDALNNGGFYLKLYTLQKRLKGERLFIRQDKDIIRSLNESVTDTCKNVYHLAWRTRQHWKNLDRLVSGARVFPSECSQTSILIENVTFEDASRHLGYQDAKYGEFLVSLRSKPKLVALLLNCATKHGVDIGGITRLLLCCLYGSCLLKEDENYVLSVLKSLIDIQIAKAEDVFQYFCSPKSSLNGFTLVLGQYSEMLFTSKLYLTAALHGAVMQIIVDDSVYLELEMSNVLNRLPPKVIRHKFGDPGTPKANKKMTDYIDSLQNCLINLCIKFLKSLKDKIYCFPVSLRWVLRQLQDIIRSKTKHDEKRTKALLGHVLMNYFICPAIVNPEPYGINSDAFVSEIARYNLAQVAGILRSLALAELGMKDLKTQKILAAFEPGAILSFVDAVLHDTDKLDPLNEKETVEGLNPNAALMTEKELKTLVHFLKKAESENDPELKEHGISELLELLPPIPRRWTKQRSTPQRTATSLPIAMQLKANPELMQPSPSPRTNKQKAKKTASLYSPRTDIQPALEVLKEEQTEQQPQNDREEYESILKDLQDMIDEQEVALVISFGADDDVPGMLSEEKVLGIKDNVVQSAPVDSDDIEEERQRRASTMIQGAMKDLEGLNFHDPIKEDTPDADQKSLDSSFFSDASCSVDNTPKSTPVSTFIGVEADNDSVFASGDKLPTDCPNIMSNGSFISSPAQSNIGKPNKDYNLLIEFDEVDSQVKDAGLAPVGLTPHQQNNSLLDISPTRNVDAFNSPAHDAFFDNRSATLGPIRSTPQPPLSPFSKTASLGRNLDPISTDKRNSHVSTGSLLGGLNTMLQQPPRTLSNSFAFRSDDRFLAEERAEDLESSIEIAEDAVIEQDSDSSEGDEEAMEGTSAESSSKEQTRETSCESPIPDPDLIASEAKGNPSEEAKRGYDSPVTKRSGKGIMSCVVDTKSETLKQLKMEMAEQEKRDRKKSSGAWLMGKLATGKEKIKSVKKRTKSDGHGMRKERDAKREQKMTEPQNQPKLKVENEAETNSRPQTPTRSSEISEGILQKYRVISSGSAGLMEGNQSSDDVAVKQEIEFDDDFKFEDAKRKLRIVLCMADRSNFPSGASSCLQLFMTFLQAQLAEAINLQDRSVVAQLHETLRSIRQLPDGSCEKLLVALEEDYKRRAPYISYLLRSKQGLLASMSHLEQIRKKVERDKAICSKYFTTVCVRLFLETPEKRKEIAQFSQKFEDIGMVDEKCALLEEFLDDVYKEMSSDPTWVSALNEQWSDAKIATERTIMSKIYKAAFYPNGLQDIENDKIFHDHINRLSRVITVNHKALQIPKVLQKEAPWPSAQTELLMINAYKTPADKLRCIHRCCIAIMNLLSMATPNQTSGADEFVPVLVYVLIRANPPNLLSTKQYINNFFDNRLSGEEMYCWTQFCAAAEFVKSLKS